VIQVNGKKIGDWDLREAYRIARNRRDAEETVARVVVMPLSKGTRDQEREMVVTMDAVT